MSLPKTAFELIARSVAMHPTAYAEAVANMARDHRAWAARTYRGDVAEIARDMADACDMVVRNIEADDVDVIVLEDCQRIPAVTAAARLQCIPAHVVRELV